VSGLNARNRFGIGISSPLLSGIAVIKLFASVWGRYWLLIMSAMLLFLKWCDTRVIACDVEFVVLVDPVLV